MLEKVHIRNRVSALKLRAANRFNIAPEKCHIGHLILQGMLDNPKLLNQIDASTDTNETNSSVALRSMRLASAFRNFGLKPGDAVVVMGPNHLDMAIPLFACHFNGLSLCGMDPNIGPADLNGLFPYITPKITFCQKSEVEYVKEAYTKINFEGKIVIFDDKDSNMVNFIKEYDGSEVNFIPEEIDHSTTMAWLLLTSGTTGIPKVAMIPYDTLLNGICTWWEPYRQSFEVALTMKTFQWLSSLLYYVGGPIRRYTRLQCSAPLTPEVLVRAINKYKPGLTAWTPHTLDRFLQATENVCDMTCFKYIAVAGSPMDRSTYERIKKRTNAYLYLVYSMTELIVPGFDYREDTPFGSVGKPYDSYEYKLVDDNGNKLDKPSEKGELWIKGDAFFKGYLGNLEETRKILTEDGWFKTGDMFYRDENDYYYFYERKRLLIKSAGYWISPLKLEEIIQRHPAVLYACVVGIPDKERIEVPVAAIVKKKETQIQPKEIFDLIRANMPEQRLLHGGYFYMDSLPTTTTGKVHRVKIKELAIAADRILDIGAA